MGATRGLQDNIPSIQKGSSTTVTLAATNNGQSTRITIGGQQYRLSAGISLSTSIGGQLGGLDTGSIAANTLYYVYACVSSSVVGLVASVTAPATGPSGFAGRYKLLGRFRTDFGGASVNTVAPDPTILSLPTAPMTSFTPIYTGLGTVTTLFAYYTRRADIMDVYARFTTGTTDGTNSSFGLPTGLSMDTSKITNTANIGDWIRNNSGAANRKRGKMLANTATAVNFTSDDQSAAVSPFSLVAGSGLFSNTEVVSVQFSVPIAEWQGLFT